MRSFDVSPEALDDLREIGDWIAPGSPVRAVGLLAELRGRFGRLAKTPSMGRPRDAIGAGVRSVPHGASYQRPSTMTAGQRDRAPPPLRRDGRRWVSIDGHWYE